MGKKGLGISRDQGLGIKDGRLRALPGKNRFLGRCDYDLMAISNVTTMLALWSKTAEETPAKGAASATRHLRRKSEQLPWIAWAILATIVAGAMGIRMFRLGDRSIWFDEAVSWRFLQFPIGGMLQRLCGENYPPFYILALRLWRDLFGESLIALRGLSVLLAGVATGATYLFAATAFAPWRPQGGPTACGRRALWRTGKTSVVATRLGDLRSGANAVSHTSIGERCRCEGEGGADRGCGFQGDVDRAGVGGVFRREHAPDSPRLGNADVLTRRALVMLSSWAQVCALCAVPQRAGPWLLYAVVTLLFAYTHYFALFSIAGQVLFTVGYLVATRRRHAPLASHAEETDPHVISASPPHAVAPAVPTRPHAEREEYFRRLRFAAVAYAILAAGWAPWVPVFLKQAQQVREHWWYASLVDFWEVPAVLYKSFIPLDRGDPGRAEALVVTVVCVATLVGILIRGRAGEWYTLCLVAAPLGMAVLVSVLSRDLVVVRYFAFLQPFLLVAFAALTARIPGRALRNIAAGMLFVNALAIYADTMESLNIPGHPGAGSGVLYRAKTKPAGNGNRVLPAPLPSAALPRAGSNVVAGL